MSIKSFVLKKPRCNFAHHKAQCLETHFEVIFTFEVTESVGKRACRGEAPAAFAIGQKGARKLLFVHLLGVPPREPTSCVRVQHHHHHRRRRLRCCTVEIESESAKLRTDLAYTRRVRDTLDSPPSGWNGDASSTRALSTYIRFHCRRAIVTFASQLPDFPFIPGPHVPKK